MKEKLAHDYSHENRRLSCPRHSFSHRNVDTRSAEKTSRFLPCHSDIRPLSAMMPRSLIIIRVARERGARNSVYTHLVSAYMFARKIHEKERRKEKEQKKRTKEVEEEEDEEVEGEEEDEEKKSSGRAKGRERRG